MTALRLRYSRSTSRRAARWASRPRAPGGCSPVSCRSSRLHRGARITTAHALAWARQPASAHPGLVGREALDGPRLRPPCASHRSAARDSCRRSAPGPVPTCDARPSIRPRRSAKLLQATRSMPSTFRGLTHETLFGLLAATGLRVGEAIPARRPGRRLGPAAPLVIRASKSVNSLLAKSFCTPRSSARCGATPPRGGACTPPRAPPASSFPPPARASSTPTFSTRSRPCAGAPGSRAPRGEDR